jgi:hypothetical protein
MSSASFAAAQERVNAQLRSQFLARQASIRESPLSRLSYPFNCVASPLSSLWLIVSGREGTRPAFRVGQVDAELLDEELLELLKGQGGEALKYYRPHLRDDSGQEILLVLRAVLFELSIWDHNASYGSFFAEPQICRCAREELLVRFAYQVAPMASEPASSASPTRPGIDVPRRFSNSSLHPSSPSPARACSCLKQKEHPPHSKKK